MKRQYIYAAVGLPILVLIIYLVAVPGGTRSTFLSEFVHRTKLMFGFEPEPIVGADGELGLRLERPEEYGMAPSGEDETDEDGTSGEDSAESSVPESTADANNQDLSPAETDDAPQ